MYPSNEAVSHIAAVIEQAEKTYDPKAFESKYHAMAYAVLSTVNALTVASRRDVGPASR